MKACSEFLTIGAALLIQSQYQTRATDKAVIGNAVAKKDQTGTSISGLKVLTFMPKTATTNERGMNMGAKVVKVLWAASSLDVVWPRAAYGYSTYLTSWACSMAFPLCSTAIKTVITGIVLAVYFICDFSL
ncbi:hypothetical protein WAI453_006856 [Rhynchosporium graminicola]